MLHCLPAVKERYLLYANEDYLFYAPADLNKATQLARLLASSPFYSFIKFVYANDTMTYIGSNLYRIDSRSMNNFSQTLSFWDTSILYQIHKLCPRSEIGVKGSLCGHLEVAAQKVCRQLDIVGLCYYDNEPKRGKYHYDSSIFPHIASALVKGRWNTEEYPELDEIRKLLDEDC
jgi:hypothetical protein